MTKAAFKDLVIKLDKATVQKTITSYVTSINGWSLERLLEEVTSAGDTVDKWAAVGLAQKSEVVLTGPYDDTADGLYDIVSNWTDDSEQTLELTLVSGDVITVECLLSKYEVNPSRGAFHALVVTLRPTGAVT